MNGELRYMMAEPRDRRLDTVRELTRMRNSIGADLVDFLVHQDELGEEPAERRRPAQRDVIDESSCLRACS